MTLSIFLTTSHIYPLSNVNGIPNVNMLAANSGSCCRHFKLGSWSTAQCKLCLTRFRVSVKFINHYFLSPVHMVAMTATICTGASVALNMVR